MPNDELPGIYFGETVTTLTGQIAEEDMVCFVVQSTESIPSIDNKCTLFADYESFESVATDKGLPKTLAFIDAVLTRSGKTSFYVYGVRTDTIAGYSAAITSSTHIKELRHFVYFEETKTDLSVATKMTALRDGCNNCYRYGAFRTVTVIPDATIADAVTNANANTPKEQTVVSTFTTLLNGVSSGRLNVAVPDGASTIVGHILGIDFYEEPSVAELGAVELEYAFDYGQMKSLMNLGVLFIRQKRIGGVTVNKINFGVNTGYNSSSADGTIKARRIADELLHNIDYALDEYIGQDDHANNIVLAQTSVDSEVSEFASAGYVDQAGTLLTVADTGTMKMGVDGTITTTKPLREIDVNTVIN